MTALSSLLDPAENDTEVLGIFDPAGCEVTVSVETKVSEVTGWTAWEFKIDTKGTNEGHAAVDHAHTTTKNRIPTTTEEPATQINEDAFPQIDEDTLWAGLLELA